jgi:hypothetical protein
MPPSRSHRRSRFPAIGSSRWAPTPQWRHTRVRRRALSISAAKPLFPASPTATPTWIARRCGTCFPRSGACAPSATFRTGSPSSPEESSRANGSSPCRSAIRPIISTCPTFSRRSAGPRARSSTPRRRTIQCSSVPSGVIGAEPSRSCHVPIPRPCAAPATMPAAPAAFRNRRRGMVPSTAVAPR